MHVNKSYHYLDAKGMFLSKERVIDYHLPLNSNCNYNFRYILIGYYANYRKIYTKINIAIMIISVWFFSFGMMIPPLADVWGTLGLDKSTFSCTILR